LGQLAGAGAGAVKTSKASKILLVKVTQMFSNLQKQTELMNTNQQGFYKIMISFASNKLQRSEMFIDTFALL
jgi:hypothetical protein